MGQTVDGGLQYLNVNDRYKKGQEIPGSDFAVEKNRYMEPDMSIFKEELVGYKYEKKDGGYQTSTVDNFEEYLKNKQEKAKEAGEDARSKEEKAKEEAKEISRSLSGEEIKQLKMMGVDVSGAKLSDIMGMVNTMRGKAHREELAKTLANISAGNGDMEDLTVIGGTAKVAGTDVEVDSVDVADVMIAKEAPEKDTPVEKEADNLANFKLTNNELVYIIKNELSLSKDNMYKAHFSGSMSGKEMVSEDVLKEMMPQIEKVIEQAGIEKDEVAFEGAKFLMDNNLPITTDNLKTYVEYQQYQGKDIGEVILPEIKEDTVTKKAQQIVEDVASFKVDMVYDMVKANKQITIASMSKYAKEYNAKSVGKDTAKEDMPMDYSDKDMKDLTALRQLEEIRLSMTMDAAVKLVKADFNIDTRELSKVVSRLKNMEELIIKSKLRDAGVQPTKENVDLYQELNVKVEGLANGHASILASPLKGLDFSVNTLFSEKQIIAEDMLQGEYETVKRDARYKSFEAATSSYEAVGTAPRKDMGDSITKAFANVTDILKEMELPVNYENERAVRILGYNSMEITPENISKVVDYDRQVNQLMDTFYPEAVLSMIKDGINPLDVPIEELNDIIRKHNYNDGVTEAENFATYLRDMEKQGLVSPEERESYIGIYRAMDKLAKSGDREAGWVFNSGAELTVRNLISAMRSRKASGIDISINESFGMLEETVSFGKDIEKQIDSAFNLNQEEKEVEDYMARVAEATEEVWNFLVANNIEVTGVNVVAAENMLNTQGGIYQLVSELLAKMKFKTDIKEELVDDETEHMKDSMSGEDVLLPFSPDSILESLLGSEEMSLKYEDLRDKVTELMYDAGVMGTITSMDISAIKTISAGFNVMSNMAKNHRYQLPVETETGVKVVNLTIAKGETNQGTIDISMDDESMGNVTAKIMVSSEKVLFGHVVSSTTEGNYMLQEKKEIFDKALAASDFNGASVNLGAMSYMDETQNFADTEMATLYEASVALVRAISGFFG